MVRLTRSSTIANANANANANATCPTSTYLSSIRPIQWVDLQQSLQEVKEAYVITIDRLRKTAIPLGTQYVNLARLLQRFVNIEIFRKVLPREAALLQEFHCECVPICRA